MKSAQIAKGKVISEIKDKLAKSKAAVVVDYRGLTVAQVSDLRRKLKVVGGEMMVTKNTLVLRALEDRVAESLAGILKGPTAVVFSADEVSGPKVLATFAKNAGLPTFKGGLMGDRVLTVDEVSALSLIPGREILNAKLVGILAGGPTRLAWALSGELRKLVLVLSEIQKSKAN
jgi:large subunit ribosomal protein L10